MGRWCIFLFACAIHGSHALSQMSADIDHGGPTTPALSLTEETGDGGGFEENLGQVYQTSGEPAPFVRYRMTSRETSVFLLDHGIALQFAHVHRPDGFARLQAKRVRSPSEEARLTIMEADSHVETFRMDMILDGAAPAPRISATGRSKELTHYHNRGVRDVHTYREVVYHDVYPGIDWSIRATANGFEHDFIVRPGGDPSRIKLRFAGHEELLIDEEGRLVHGNRLGRSIEERPVSYQDGAAIATRFRLEDDLLTFEVGSYDRSRALLIDPERSWGTYFGGSSEEWAYGLARDADGNAYMGGLTASVNDIAGVGAHDESFAGVYDAFLVKFSSLGERVWSTYFGGDSSDAFGACAIRGNAVYAAGSTRSFGLGTLTAHQAQLGGGSDGLLVKFDLDGQVEWATYYGGSASDQGRSCAIDPSGNVYLAGVTGSSEAGVIGAGGHQDLPGGSADAFLVKFDPAGQRQWGTYYGGYNYNEAMCCATAANGSVYLAGGTNEESGATIATSGGQQTAFGGQADAFLAKFDSTGLRKWGTYYGSTGVDYGFTCTTDDADNVYLGGDTYSLYGIAHNAHQNNHGGGGLDAFLVKLDGSGERLWATYCGGDSIDECRGSATDEAGNVYLVGQSGSLNGIAWYGPQMDHGGGGKDGYLVRFSSGGVRMFGTYYGGAGYDEATAVVAASGDIHLCGQTGSMENIATPGAHSSALNGPHDTFLVKFVDTEDCLGVVGGMAYPGTACDDGDVCTVGDLLDDDCVCLGVPLSFGPISGPTTILDGPDPSYVYDVPEIPGGVYNWSLPPGWSAGALDSSSVEVSAPTGADTADLCVTVSSGACPSGTVCLTITVLVTGVEEAANSFGGPLVIRPNPNNGRFQLIGSGRWSGPATMQVIDATGHVVRSTRLPEGAYRMVDLGDLPAGVFTLRLDTDGRIGAQRFVIR